MDSQSTKKSIPSDNFNDAEKQIFQRTWTKKDNIALLKDMIEYTAINEFDPFANMLHFNNFIKKSMHVDVNNNKVLSKPMRLKKKM